MRELACTNLKAQGGSKRGKQDLSSPSMGHKAGKGLEAARAAETDAASHRATAARKQQQVAGLEERAQLFGGPVKQSAQAKVIERKWLRFLLVHGEKYGFNARVGPSLELVKHFVAYSYCTRNVVSVIGREGMGDSFELQIRYMLAKFVFVSLKYNGWSGLNAHELHKKAEPFKFAVKEQWQRLKRSDPDLMSTLKPFVKTKWCDTAYFQAQVRSFVCCRVRRRAAACGSVRQRAYVCTPFRAAGAQHVAFREGGDAPGALRHAHGGDGLRAGDVLARWISLQGLVRPRGQDGVLAHAQRAERERLCVGQGGHGAGVA